MAPPASPETDPLRDYLRKIKTDTLSPRQALDVLYELEALLKE